jgi:hypothetical protein
MRGDRLAMMGNVVNRQLQMVKSNIGGALLSAIVQFVLIVLATPALFLGPGDIAAGIAGPGLRLSMAFRRFACAADPVACCAHLMAE